MLLRNIKPCSAHVNGTRYLVERISANFLFLTSVSGSKKGARVTLSRMNCSVPAEDFPIPMFRRRQFPGRVCFAMTINKAQGQSIIGSLGLSI